MAVLAAFLRYSSYCGVKRLGDFGGHFHEGNCVLRGGQDLFLVDSFAYCKHLVKEHKTTRRNKDMLTDLS
jgi:hypothetical protein